MRVAMSRHSQIWLWELEASACTWGGGWGLPFVMLARITFVFSALYTQTFFIGLLARRQVTLGQRKLLCKAKKGGSGGLGSVE